MLLLITFRLIWEHPDLVEMWSIADFGPVESCCDASYLEVRGGSLLSPIMIENDSTKDP